MKKKFGSYTINVSKKHSKVLPDGKLALEVTLSGNIEIGIELDKYTWRADWLLQLFFGDKSSNYRITSIENNDTWSGKPDYIEINTVKAIVETKQAWCNTLF